eukprot:scaffold3287_cov135-Skeletonema_dohrnii-CCMP3373.AAC.2
MDNIEAEPRNVGEGSFGEGRHQKRANDRIANGLRFRFPRFFSFSRWKNSKPKHRNHHVVALLLSKKILT